MEDRIYIIIAKTLQNEASDAEHHELDAWLQADVKHASILADMQATWGETDALFDTPQFDTAAAWEKVSLRMHPPAQVGGPKRSRTMAFPAWVKYSSAIAAMLIIAFALWNPFSTDIVRIAAADGNQRIELPDHSIITLRKGSSFSYPKRFAARERKVSLEGEAFFEVAHNAQQPFVIDAKSVSVTVLGTTFNVQCDAQTADVTVATGRVLVTPTANTTKSVILTPGNKAHYQNNTLTQAVASGSEALWKKDTLSFNNEPFIKVLSAIADLKDTVLQLDASLSQAQQEQPVTISFRNQSLEDMLTELCLITNCRWEKRGTAYLVLAK